jgi:hypothetical protein
MEILSECLSKIKEELNENEIFSLLNLLADFIQHNEQYSVISIFNELTEMLVETIDFCNSSYFNNDDFFKKYRNIPHYLLELQQEVKNKYNLVAHFCGTDKYGIINSIISENVELKRGFFGGDSKSKKNDNEFRILILSEETFNEEVDFANYDEVIQYDHIMNEIFRITREVYHFNYDYNFLSNAIEEAKQNNISEIIVGSSYSMYGLDTKK